jgi:hypothetical protein
MLNDFPAPQGMRPPSKDAATAYSMNLWITGGSLQSGLHFDSHYNSLTVLSGVKTIILFPPTETKHLYKVGNVAKANVKGTSAHGGVRPPEAVPAALHDKTAARAVKTTTRDEARAGAGAGAGTNANAGANDNLLAHGNEQARARDFQAAKLSFAAELSGGDTSQLPALLKHLSKGKSWPAPMIGLFAATYQLQVEHGTLTPTSQWPAEVVRLEASRAFSTVLCFSTWEFTAPPCYLDSKMLLGLKPGISFDAITDLLGIVHSLTLPTVNYAAMLKAPV